MTDEEIDEIAGCYVGRPGIVLPSEYPISCLLGCVDVVDCLSQEDYRQKVFMMILFGSIKLVMCR